MLRWIRLSAVFGMLIFAFTSCAETPVDEAPVAEAPAPPPEPEGPFYELTKDDVTTNEGWTSRNIMFKGAKIGDKTTSVEKNFGAFDSGDTVGDHIRTIYEKSSYAAYTFKMTGELQKIELFSRYADQIKDAKLRRLLSSGDVDYMREAFGPEESMEFNGMTTAEEYIYDSKGFRFARYDLGGTKVNSLIFSKIAR